MIAPQRRAGATTSMRTRSRLPLSNFASLYRQLLRFSTAYPQLSRLGLFLGGLIIGFFLHFIIVITTHSIQIERPVSNTSSGSTQIIPEDFLSTSTEDNEHELKEPTFSFVFSTGRCGTQHLSRALRSSGQRRAYITHEEEHETLRTRDIVQRDYRRLVSGAVNHEQKHNETTFNQSMQDFIRRVKLPFYKRLLAAHHARHLVYTGHLPAAFGLLPSLIDMLPRGSVRVLRLRRDRVATALSLMALGPETEDPWGATSANEQSASPPHRRWFPVPSDTHIKLRVSSSAWHSFNRFQRWLWYGDEIECQWQALRISRNGAFSFAHFSLDSLHVLDGGENWRHLAEFMGTDVDLTQAFTRHNSIQFKNRSKEVLEEAVLRQWDQEYREAVGPCQISPNQVLSWRPT